VKLVFLLVNFCFHDFFDNQILAGLCLWCKLTEDSWNQLGALSAIKPFSAGFEQVSSVVDRFFALL
jgi:hypothetical protein